MNPTEKENIVFNPDSLDNFQTNIGASSNEIKKLTNMLRSTAGRKSVPAYYSQHVSERSRTLENICKSDEMKFDTESSVKENRPVVWADAEELVEAVVTKRNLIGMHKIKIMADSGGIAFFKICMSILPENYLSDSNLEDDPFFNEIKIR